MWAKEVERTEKPQCVVDAEARITAEEAAMTKEEKDARFRRATVELDSGRVFRR